MNSGNFFFTCEKSHMGILTGTVFILMICLIIGPCNADRSSYDWNNLGTTYYYQGDYPNAIQAFLNSIYIDPNQVIAWNNLGIAYQANNQYSEAQDAFRHAISLNNGYDEGWSNLANVYQYQGRYDDYNFAMKHVHQGFIHQGIIIKNFDTRNYNNVYYHNEFDTHHGQGYYSSPNPNWNEVTPMQYGGYNTYDQNFPGYYR